MRPTRLLILAALSLAACSLGLAFTAVAGATTTTCSINEPWSIPGKNGPNPYDVCGHIVGNGRTIDRVDLSMQIGDVKPYFKKQCGVFQLNKDDPNGGTDGDGGGTIIWVSKRVCAYTEGKDARATYTGPYTYKHNGSLTIYWLPYGRANYKDDTWTSTGINS